MESEDFRRNVKVKEKAIREEKCKKGKRKGGKGVDRRRKVREKGCWRRQDKEREWKIAEEGKGKGAGEEKSSVKLLEKG
jgi:N-methylhydantoinase B/oxoprolinase/acetone carboxylase alpha subunit